MPRKRINHNFYLTIARNVKRELKARNLRNKDLAIILDIDPTIAYAKNRAASMYTIEEVYKVAAALSVPVQVLLKGVEAAL